MILILKRRTVAHGDDDYYTFECSYPVGLVNTEEEAERYIADIEAKYQADVDARAEGLSIHNRGWKDTHPKPERKPYIAIPKWGVMKNADITSEMRLERESIKQRNQEIERENNLAFVKWYDEFKAAEADYLKQHKLPKQQRLEYEEIEQLTVPNKS